MDHNVPLDRINSISITRGFVISHEKYLSLLVDPEITSCLTDPTWILAVYAMYPKLSRITCYPVPTPHVFKVKLHLEGSTQNILKFITQTLKNAHIVHTTGVLEKTQGNFVEYYLHGSHPSFTIEQIVQDLHNHPGIQNCDMEILPQCG